MFDVTNDGVVNEQDRQSWIKELKNTWYGDADLDGEFSSSDLSTVFAAGEYEDVVSRNSDWAEGDWDGDGDFNSADLVLALADGGYEAGRRPSNGRQVRPRQ